MKRLLVAAVVSFAAVTTTGSVRPAPGMEVFVEPHGEEQVLTVVRDGAAILTVKDERFEQASLLEHGVSKRLGYLRDVTGDGRAELVFSQWDGGRRGHHVRVFGVSEAGALREIGESVGGDGTLAFFEDVDGDGALEFRTHDWTFCGWKGSNADAPALPVVLRFRDDGVSLARDLMAQGQRQPTTVAASTTSAAQEPGDAALRTLVLEGIYAGRGDVAWDLFDAAWGDRPGKEEFAIEVFAKLAESPYWR